MYNNKEHFRTYIEVRTDALQHERAVVKTYWLAFFDVVRDIAYINMHVCAAIV